MFSRKTTRAAAAAAASAAGPSTNPTPQPSTSSAPSTMRMRSGRLLAPLVEGARTVRSKLTGGRRGAKAPAEVPAPPEASTSARADATSSNVAHANPAPAPRKAAPKKRPTTARARATKRKAAVGSSAPAPLPEDDSIAVASAPIAIAAPAPVPVAVPPRAATASRGPSPPHSDALARSAVPEHRRLQRQGACYLDRHGWALPEGVYLDKDGNPPLSALLEVIEKEVSLESFLGELKLPVKQSIYGYTERKAVPVYQPFYFPLRTQHPAFNPTPIIIGPTYAHEWVVQGEWNPIVFPSVPELPPQDPNAPLDPRIGTLITRQYADFFGEDGFSLPFEDDGTGEQVPIGEIVANVLKAGRTGPYPAIWRGSLFEPEGEASPRAAVAEPASSAVSTPPASSAVSTPPASPAASTTADRATPPAVGDNAQAARPMRPLPRPGHRLRRQHAVLIPVDENGIVTHGTVEDIRPPPPVATPISRQNAVYLDRYGNALPAGETTTAAAQFPSEAVPQTPYRAAPPQTPSRAAPPHRTDLGPPPVLRGPETLIVGLPSIFARRSHMRMVAHPFVTEDGQPGLKFAPAAEVQLPDEPEGPVDELLKSLKALEGGERAASQEVYETVLSGNAKGKKRARETDDEQARVNEPPKKKKEAVFRCTVDVREHTTELSSLLSVKVSVIPMPGGLRHDDVVVVYNTNLGKGGCNARENKRSRDEFEEGKDSNGEDSDVRAAKKARIEPEVIEIL